MSDNDGMSDPLANLQALVRLPTISRPDPKDTDWAPFRAFVNLLPILYPATHGALDREIVNDYSMLYRWKGRTDGPPTVLMAHFDVVSATEEGWTHPPFAATLVGEEDEELIWGRGARAMTRAHSCACSRAVPSSRTSSRG